MKGIKLLLGLLLLLCTFLLPAAAVTANEQTPEAARIEKMQEYIDNLYKGIVVVHTFSKDGDEISCVDVHTQPALREPGTGSKSAQSAPVIAQPPAEPSSDDSDMGPLSESRSTNRGDKEPAFVLKGGKDLLGREMACPDNSVPMILINLEQMKRFKSVEEFLQKNPPGSTPSHKSNSSKRAVVHKYAHAYKSVDNFGQEATFNIWSPYCEAASEFSLSQTWVVRGSGSDLETVEAGWQKYKQKYGDWNSRLFIYFTPDNYGSGGCYNNDCGKFVQTNKSVILGGKFSHYSSMGGTQYAITLRWQRDTSNGNWWLKYGSTYVGYYPSRLFDSRGLKDKASTVDWGGEILDTVDSRHTKTDMGSGKFPSAGFQQAAYTRNIRYITTSNNWGTPSLTESRTNKNCYDIKVTPGTGTWKTYFFFGGSGYNSKCTAQ